MNYDNANRNSDDYTTFRFWSFNKKWNKFKSSYQQIHLVELLYFISNLLFIINR